MRILHLIPSLGFGGAETQTLLLHEGLLSCGHESFILTLSTAEREKPPHTKELGLPARLRTLPAALPLLQAEVRAVSPDIIHSCQLLADVACGRLVGPTARVSTLCNMFGVAHQDVTSSPSSKALSATIGYVWSRTLSNRFRRLVAISEAVRDSFLKHPYTSLPGDRIRVIYRATRKQKRTSGHELYAIRGSFGIPISAPCILHIGRHVPQKNQDRLLAAFASLPQELGAVLLLVGQGPLTADLVELSTQLKIRDRVQFLGLREDVSDLFGCADVFAFPSLFEGLGVSGIEAAMSGVPCVFSKASALLEVMPSEDFGYHCDAKSVASIASALYRALNDRDGARQRADRLQERVAREMNLSRMINEHVKVYEDALERC
ncbi:MAG: glycosyltransferase family 4 protein [Myxococcota bacterium]